MSKRTTDMDQMILQTITNTLTFYATPRKGVISMFDIETINFFNDLLEREAGVKRRRLEKREIMKHPGVVLQNIKSGVLWEVVEVKIHEIPKEYGTSTTTVTHSIVRSKNSGRKKKINPFFKADSYKISYIPEAAKILYGWKED